MSNDSNNDPLDILFVSERPTLSQQERESLAQGIAPYVKIFVDNDQVHVELTVAGQHLSTRQKVLVVMLARKAVVLRKQDLLDKESISPKQLEVVTGVQGNSIRPQLLSLKKDRLIQSDKNSDDSGYYVPNYSLQQVLDLLNAKG